MSMRVMSRVKEPAQYPDTPSTWDNARGHIFMCFARPSSAEEPPPASYHDLEQKSQFADQTFTGGLQACAIVRYLQQCKGEYDELLWIPGAFDRLASRHELARAYQANGQIKQAVELLEHVFAVRERTLDEEHPDRLASQHALAAAYQANGQIKQAVKLLEHVVAVQERTLAKEHPLRLASRHELARAYQANRTNSLRYFPSMRKTGIFDLESVRGGAKAE